MLNNFGKYFMKKTWSKPSVFFCQTGYLPMDEKYHQDLHNYQNTIRERAKLFYSTEEIQNMEEDFKKNKDDYNKKIEQMELQKRKQKQE